MREAAEDINVIKTAASIGYRFKLDPVTILSDPDITHWVVRLTAYEYVEEQLKKPSTTNTTQG